MVTSPPFTLAVGTVPPTVKGCAPAPSAGSEAPARRSSGPSDTVIETFPITSNGPGAVTCGGSLTQVTVTRTVAVDPPGLRV